MCIFSEEDDYILLKTKNFENESTIIDFLCAVYKDKYPLLVAWNDSYYLYKMMWPLGQGLRDTLLEITTRSLFSLELNHLPYYYKREKWSGQVIFSEMFYHHWTLLTWSQWLSTNPRKNKILKPRILHFDSHDDLNKPALFSKLNREFLVPFIDNRICDVFNPPSIAKLILQGSIGIGGFITPYLWQQDYSELHHFYWSEECTEKKIISKKIGFSFEPFAFKNEIQQLSLIFLKDSMPDYYIHSSLDHLNISDNAPIFLDIDMDFFSNEFDNSKNPIKQSAPNEKELKKRIDSFVIYLSENNILNYTKVITISLSPGFYPSRFWKHFFILKARLKELVQKKQKRLIVA